MSITVKEFDLLYYNFHTRNLLVSGKDVANKVVDARAFFDNNKDREILLVTPTSLFGTPTIEITLFEGGEASKECKFYRSRDQEEYRRRKYGYQEPKAERKLQEIKKSGL
jgi:hypothetical protein